MSQTPPERPGPFEGDQASGWGPSSGAGAQADGGAQPRQFDAPNQGGAPAQFGAPGKYGAAAPPAGDSTPPTGPGPYQSAPQPGGGQPVGTQPGYQQGGYPSGGPASGGYGPGGPASGGYGPGGPGGYGPGGPGGPSGYGPGGPGGPGGYGPGGPGGPGGGGKRTSAPMIVGIVIGVLVVLALIIWGAVMLIDGRDDPIPPPPTSTGQPTDQPTDGASEDPTDEPSGDGALYGLLTAEGAEVTDEGGNTWTVSSDWTDASDLSPDALEAYTATYTSDAGDLGMTAISFPDEASADSYMARVQEERGDPDSTGHVWQSDNGNGLGTRIEYNDDLYTIYWYDASGVVYQVDADNRDLAIGFYGGLPF